MHDDASMRPVLQLRLHRRHFAHHSTKLLGGAVGRTTPRTKQQLYCLFQSLDGDSLQGETHLRDHYLHLPQNGSVYVWRDHIFSPILCVFFNILPISCNEIIPTYYRDARDKSLKADSMQALTSL